MNANKKQCTRKVAVVGLGYVGLPIAVAFAENRVKTTAFDSNKNKVLSYCKNIDPTNEVGSARISRLNQKVDGLEIKFTSCQEDLKKSDFYIVAVPTPVKRDNSPDLSCVIEATKLVAKGLKKGDIVVYESTVYPGVTEDICAPILEKFSGLKCGDDFKIGYSPERINPADEKHKINNIIKIVSGIDEEALNIIADVYETVVEVGVYRAESIKVAEAAKVIENSQRDINIAFMNELAIIFDKMKIDTKAVLDAARTKWNFIDFKPGLVGGHCIGVDQYYLTYKAAELGYLPEVILSGRRINDNMGKFIAEKTVKNLIASDVPIKGAKVAILGLTFKENCGDIRNTKVIDVINELHEYGAQTFVTDCEANADEAQREYGLSLIELETIKNVDAVVLAVAHNRYKELTFNEIKKMYVDAETNTNVLIDVKGIFNKELAVKEFNYWRL